MEGNSPKLFFKDSKEFQSYHVGQGQAFFVLVFLYGVVFFALLSVWAAADLAFAYTLPIYFAAFITVGWAQYSIGNGLHEAVHRNLCNKKSDFLASLLTAYPVGLTMTYRDFHLRHHQYLGTNRDPELELYTSFPRSKLALLSRFLWYSSGIPAVLQFFQQQRTATSSAGRRSYSEPAIFIAIQTLILGAFWFTFGNPVYYVVFWVLPVATVGKLLSTTRLLCEHGSPDRDWVVRTIDAARWQTWLMGAFDFNYHGEHHLFPSIPYAKLQPLYRLHCVVLSQNIERPSFGGRYELFLGGYLALLSHWFQILPWREPSRGEGHSQGSLHP